MLKLADATHKKGLKWVPECGIYQHRRNEMSLKTEALMRHSRERAHLLGNGAFSGAPAKEESLLSL